MKCNVGTVEGAVRIILGVALVSLVFVGPQTPWGWLGLILVATGVAGWCPINRLIGLDTCSHLEDPTSKDHLYR